MSYDPRWELLDRIWKSDTSVRVYDTTLGDPTSKADIVVDGAAVATFDGSGLALASGVAVNEFSIDATLAGDSTSVVPTEYAVKTYVDNQFAQLSTDRIVDGDSQVRVIDDPAGDATSSNSVVNFTLDGANRMVLAADGLTLDYGVEGADNATILSFSNDDTMGGLDATAVGEKGSQVYVPTQWAVRKYIDNIHYQMKEPTGFPVRTSSQYGIDQTGSSAVFYIEPTASLFNIFLRGQEFIKTSREEVAISDVEGPHYIYFDQSGVLTETTTFTTQLILDWVYVAIVYWDATNKVPLYIGEERHGITMDGRTHLNIHVARGTTYLNGLALGDLTPDSTGDADIDVQFSVESGYILDEDITNTIAAHSFPANIPMWYLDGSANWRKEAADAYPVINRGSGRVAWNKDTAGTWSQEEATEGYFVLTHVLATNDATQSVVGIVGQAEYATLAAARVGASVEINNLVSGSMPFAEFLPIATVIYQTSSAYGNTPKARLVSNDEGDSWTDWRTSGLSPAVGAATDHGSLSGLGNDDHVQYAILTGLRPFTGNQEFASGIYMSGGSLDLTAGASINEFSTDGTLGDDSDSAVPTEKAVKTYVDTEIAALEAKLDLINIREVYSDSTAVTGDVVLVDTTAGNVTIDLQTHSDGKIMIKKITTDANSVIVTNGGGGLIDNLASRSFSDSYSAYTYICDGTNFYVF